MKLSNAPRISAIIFIALLLMSYADFAAAQAAGTLPIGAEGGLPPGAFKPQKTEGPFSGIPGVTKATVGDVTTFTFGEGAAMANLKEIGIDMTLFGVGKGSTIKVKEGIAYIDGPFRSSVKGQSIIAEGGKTTFNQKTGELSIEKGGIGAHEHLSGAKCLLSAEGKIERLEFNVGEGCPQGKCSYVFEGFKTTGSKGDHIIFDSKGRKLKTEGETTVQFKDHIGKKNIEIFFDEGEPSSVIVPKGSSYKVGDMEAFAIDENINIYFDGRQEGKNYISFMRDKTVIFGSVGLQRVITVNGKDFYTFLMRGNAGTSAELTRKGGIDTFVIKDGSAQFFAGVLKENLAGAKPRYFKKGEYADFTSKGGFSWGIYNLINGIKTPSGSERTDLSRFLASMPAPKPAAPSEAAKEKPEKKLSPREQADNLMKEKKFVEASKIYEDSGLPKEALAARKEEYLRRKEIYDKVTDARKEIEKKIEKEIESGYYLEEQRDALEKKYNLPLAKEVEKKANEKFVGLEDKGTGKMEIGGALGDYEELRERYTEKFNYNTYPTGPIVDKSTASSEQLSIMKEDSAKSDFLIGKLKANLYESSLEGKDLKTQDMVELRKLLQTTQDSDVAAGITSYLVSSNSEKGSYGVAVKDLKFIESKLKQSGFKENSEIFKEVLAAKNDRLMIEGEVQNAKEYGPLGGSYIQTKVDPKISEEVRGRVAKGQQEAFKSSISGALDSQKDQIKKGAEFGSMFGSIVEDESRSTANKAVMGLFAMIGDAGKTSIDGYRQAAHAFIGKTEAGKWWDDLSGGKLKGWIGDTVEMSKNNQIAALDKKGAGSEKSFGRLVALKPEDTRYLLEESKKHERDPTYSSPAFRNLERYGLEPIDVQAIIEINRRTSDGLLTSAIQLTAKNEGEALAAQFRYGSTGQLEAQQTLNTEMTYQSLGIDPATGSYLGYQEGGLGKLAYYLSSPFQAVTHIKNLPAFAGQIFGYGKLSDMENYNNELAAQKGGLIALAKVMESGQTTIIKWKGENAEATRKNLENSGVKISPAEASQIQDILLKNENVIRQQIGERYAIHDDIGARKLQAAMFEEQAKYNQQIGSLGDAKTLLMKASKFDESKDYSEQIKSIDKQMFRKDSFEIVEQAGNLMAGPAGLSFIGGLAGKAAGRTLAIAETRLGLTLPSSLTKPINAMRMEGYVVQSQKVIDEIAGNTVAGKVRSILGGRAPSSGLIEEATAAHNSLVKAGTIQQAEASFAKISQLAGRTGVENGLLKGTWAAKQWEGAVEATRPVFGFLAPREFGEEMGEEMIGNADQGLFEGTRAFGGSLGSAISASIGGRARGNIALTTKSYNTKASQSFSDFMGRQAQNIESSIAYYKGMPHAPKFDFQTGKLNLIDGEIKTISDLDQLSNVQLLSPDGTVNPIVEQAAIKAVNDRYEVLSEPLKKAEEEARRSNDERALAAVSASREVMEASKKAEIAQQETRFAQAKIQVATSQGKDISSFMDELSGKLISQNQKESAYYQKAKTEAQNNIKSIGGETERINLEYSRAKGDTKEDLRRALIIAKATESDERLKVAEMEMNAKKAELKATKEQKDLAKRQNSPQLAMLETQYSQAQQAHLSGQLEYNDAKLRKEEAWQEITKTQKADSKSLMNPLERRRQTKAIAEQLEYHDKTAENIRQDNKKIENEKKVVSLRNQLVKKEISMPLSQSESEILQKANEIESLAAKIDSIKESEDSLKDKFFSLDIESRFGNEGKGTALLLDLEQEAKNRENLEKQKSEAIDEVIKTASESGIAVELEAKVPAELKSKAKDVLEKIKMPAEEVEKLLTAERVEAIQRAHEIGTAEGRHLGPKHEDGTYKLEEGTYTLSDIKEKDRILSEAGFTHDEIKGLMDYGVVGREAVPEKVPVVKPVVEARLEQKSSGEILSAIVGGIQKGTISKEQIYGIYSGGTTIEGKREEWTESTPQEKKEYVDRIKEAAEKADVKFRFSWNQDLTEEQFKEDPYKDGWAYAYGKAGMPSGKKLTRIYLNSKGDAAKLIGIISSELAKTRASGVSGLFGSKVEWAMKTDPDFNRKRDDRTVGYFNDKDGPRVLETINRIAREHPELFNEGTPLFAKPVERGVAVAKDPSIAGESFGGIIEKSIKDGMERAKSRGVTEEREIVEIIKEEFEKNGLDPENPYLRKGEKDKFAERYVNREKAVPAEVAPAVPAVEKPAEVLPIIKTAKNFGELKKALEGIGSITTREGKTYSAGELNKIIADVRAGEETIFAITRTEGLRDAVNKLMLEEKYPEASAFLKGKSASPEFIEANFRALRIPETEIEIAKERPSSRLPILRKYGINPNVVMGGVPAVAPPVEAAPPKTLEGIIATFEQGKLAPEQIKELDTFNRPLEGLEARIALDPLTAMKLSPVSSAEAIGKIAEGKEFFSLSRVPGPGGQFLAISSEKGKIKASITEITDLTEANALSQQKGVGYRAGDVFIKRAVADLSQAKSMSDLEKIVSGSKLRLRQGVTDVEIKPGMTKNGIEAAMTNAMQRAGATSEAMKRAGQTGTKSYDAMTAGLTVAEKAIFDVENFNFIPQTQFAEGKSSSFDSAALEKDISVSRPARATLEELVTKGELKAEQLEVLSKASDSIERLQRTADYDMRFPRVLKLEVLKDLAKAESGRIAFADMDNFRDYNRRYPPSEGVDKGLGRLVDVIVDTTEGYAKRLGVEIRVGKAGDEFMIWTPEKMPEADFARMVAEVKGNVQKEFAAERFLAYDKYTGKQMYDKYGKQIEKTLTVTVAGDLNVYKPGEFESQLDLINQRLTKAKEVKNKLALTDKDVEGIVPKIVPVEKVTKPIAGLEDIDILVGQIRAGKEAAPPAGLSFNERMAIEGKLMEEFSRGKTGTEKEIIRENWALTYGEGYADLVTSPGGAEFVRTKSLSEIQEKVNDFGAMAVLRREGFSAKEETIGRIKEIAKTDPSIAELSKKPATLAMLNVVYDSAALPFVPDFNPELSKSIGKQASNAIFSAENYITEQRTVEKAAEALGKGEKASEALQLQKPSKQISFGASSAFMDSVPEHTGPLTSLQKAIEIGMKVHEFAVDLNLWNPNVRLAEGYSPEMGEAIKALAGENGIKLTVHGPIFDAMPGFKPEASDMVREFKKTVDLAKDIGAETVVTHLKDPNDASSLVEIIRYADKKGIVILVENTHLKGKYHTAEEFTKGLESIMKENPGKFGILVDVAHFNLAEGNAIEHVKKTIEWAKNKGIEIEEVHVNQNDGKADSHLALSAEGTVPNAEAIKLLTEKNPGITIISEQAARISDADAEVVLESRIPAEVAAPAVGRPLTTEKVPAGVAGFIRVEMLVPKPLADFAERAGEFLKGIFGKKPAASTTLTADATRYADPSLHTTIIDKLATKTPSEAKDYADALMLGLSSEQIIYPKERLNWQKQLVNDIFKKSAEQAKEGQLKSLRIYIEGLETIKPEHIALLQSKGLDFAAMRLPYLFEYVPEEYQDKVIETIAKQRSLENADRYVDALADNLRDTKPAVRERIITEIMKKSPEELAYRISILQPITALTQEQYSKRGLAGLFAEIRGFPLGIMDSTTGRRFVIIDNPAFQRLTPIKRFRAFKMVTAHETAHVLFDYAGDKVTVKFIERAGADWPNIKAEFIELYPQYRSWMQTTDKNVINEIMAMWAGDKQLKETNPKNREFIDFVENKIIDDEIRSHLVQDEEGNWYGFSKPIAAASKAVATQILKVDRSQFAMAMMGERGAPAPKRPKQIFKDSSAMHQNLEESDLLSPEGELEAIGLAIKAGRLKLEDKTIDKTPINKLADSLLQVLRYREQQIRKYDRETTEKKLGRRFVEEKTYLNFKEKLPEIIESSNEFLQKFGKRLTEEEITPIKSLIHYAKMEYAGRISEGDVQSDKEIIVLYSVVTKNIVFIVADTYGEWLKKEKPSQQEFENEIIVTAKTFLRNQLDDLVNKGFLNKEDADAYYEMREIELESQLKFYVKEIFDSGSKIYMLGSEIEEDYYPYSGINDQRQLFRAKLAAEKLPDEVVLAIGEDVDFKQFAWLLRKSKNTPMGNKAFPQNFVVASSLDDYYRYSLRR